MTSPTPLLLSHSLPAPDNVIPLRPPSRWHDPLQLIEQGAPARVGRIVLWSVCVLVLLMFVWAAIGQLDIIATAEGKLSPQTLVKIVQPAESGVVTELLVNEGDTVQAGQVLARLDTTLARADKSGIASDLATQQLQSRRITAELADQPMTMMPGDDPQRFAAIHNQYLAHRQAFRDSLDQEAALLVKVRHEHRSASETLAKLEQTLPTYQRTADAYVRLDHEGFIAGIAAADKQRDLLEKSKDRDAQRSTVAALDATIAAQQQRLSQLRSSYRSDLQKELADTRARLDQLQPNLDKSTYREGLLELRAPQAGTIKDLATTTIGAVVQPGTVVLTLVPQGEQLFADVNIKNEDVGFVQVGQRAQIKLATYPFQRYGMMSGTVVRVSADATEVNRATSNSNGATNNNGPTDNGNQSAGSATYKARIALDQQMLRSPQGKELALGAGMQVVGEINQGKRTVLEYLLSPVQKAVAEAGRER
ncbi:MAG: hemolysin D [Burkholderiaceae bacterium]|jgi:hemolysin D